MTVKDEKPAAFPVFADDDPLADLLALLKRETSDPSSPLYLPAMIFGQYPQSFDPFVPSGDWPLTIDGDQGTDLANTVCGDIGNEGFGQIWIGTPGAMPQINLSSITVTGLANAQISSLDGNYNPEVTVNGTVLLCTLPKQTITVNINNQQVQRTIEPNIQVSATFDFRQSCCTKDLHASTPSKQVCVAGSTTQQEGKGTAIMTITGAKVTLSMTATFQSQFPKILLTTTKLGVDPSSVTWAAPQITIDLDPSDSDWDKAANAAFSKPAVQSAIVGKINDVLGSDSAHQELATQLQTVLNQYLQNSHQYPYDAAAVLRVF